MGMNSDFPNGERPDFEGALNKIRNQRRMATIYSFVNQFSNEGNSSHDLTASEKSAALFARINRYGRDNCVLMSNSIDRQSKIISTWRNDVQNGDLLIKSTNYRSRGKWISCTRNKAQILVTMEALRHAIRTYPKE